MHTPSLKLMLNCARYIVLHVVPQINGFLAYTRGNIGPTEVTLTGFIPQNSKVDFFNWLTLGRPNANQ